MGEFRPYLYIGGAVMAAGVIIFMLYLGSRLQKISGYPIYVRMAFMTYGLPAAIALVYFIWRIYEIYSLVPDLLLFAVLLSPLLGSRYRKNIEEATREADPAGWKRWEEKSKTVVINGMIRPLLPGGEKKPESQKKTENSKKSKKGK
jgi:hypothetical protein